MMVDYLGSFSTMSEESYFDDDSSELIEVMRPRHED